MATSRTPRVAAACKLLRRAGRDATGLFLAEGPQAVRAALMRAAADTDHPVHDLFGTVNALDRHADLVDLATSVGCRLTRVSDEGLARLSETVTPSGLVAVCSAVDVPLDVALTPPPRLAAVLAETRDPGNAGTALRTADAAGAGAVLFAGDSVDPYNGKCVRASAGSLFHVRIVRAVAVPAAISGLRAAGLRVLAADVGGEADLDDLAASGNLAAPTAWLFGNEAHGLTDELAAQADVRVRIPIHGRAESLNLAAAVAVCLYASARAQRTGRPAWD